MILSMDSTLALVLITILVVSTWIAFTPVNPIDKYVGSDILSIYEQSRDVKYVEEIENLTGICGSLYLDNQTLYHRECACRDKLKVDKMILTDDGWKKLSFSYCGR